MVGVGGLHQPPRRPATRQHEVVGRGVDAGHPEDAARRGQGREGAVDVDVGRVARQGGARAAVVGERPHDVGTPGDGHRAPDHGSVEHAVLEARSVHPHGMAAAGELVGHLDDHAVHAADERHVRIGEGDAHAGGILERRSCAEPARAGVGEAVEHGAERRARPLHEQRAQEEGGADAGPPQPCSQTSERQVALAHDDRVARAVVERVRRGAVAARSTPTARGRRGPRGRSDRRSRPRGSAATSRRPPRRRTAPRRAGRRARSRRGSRP